MVLIEMVMNKEEFVEFWQSRSDPEKVEVLAKMKEEIDTLKEILRNHLIHGAKTLPTDHYLFLRKYED
jgi:hypothetical protein